MKRLTPEQKAEREVARAAKRERARRDKVRPTCLHCGPAGVVDLVKGDVIYPHREDLRALNIWLCACGARVGCHKPGIKPLGSPADARTREARGRAHAAFDPLWKAKAYRDAIAYSEARRDGYRWLGEQLGLASEDCHIGMMDEAMANRVVQVIKKVRKQT